MSKVNPVDPNVPAGSEDPTLGDNRIRELANAVAELLGVDHYMGSDGGAGTGYNDDAAGEHAVITLRAQTDPTVETGKGYLYGKTVSGVVELFFKDKDGNVIQLTAGGAFNVALLSGKTIASPTLTSPVLNAQATGTAVLDEDNMASNSALKLATQQSIKAYIDAQIATQIAAIGSLFGAWASKDNNTSYEAVTDGFVSAYSPLNTQPEIVGHTDGSNPPTTVRTRNYLPIGASCYANLMMPVRKGDYWKITGALYVWWLPIGA